MINLKDSAHKIKMQAAALRLLLDGMEAADWTDETPLGVEIFLDHIITEINRLYNALPGEPSGASILPSGLYLAEYEQVSNLREKIKPSGASKPQTGQGRAGRGSGGRGGKAGKHGKK